MKHTSKISKAILAVLLALVLVMLLPSPAFAVMGTWSNGPSMSVTRGAHAAVLLQDGRVLVSGGYNGSYLTSAEIYDPASNSWSSAGNMAIARQNHTMTLLPNGKVLVAGGHNPGGITAAELFDPATKTWSSAGDMSTARVNPIAVALPTGKVLVAGGSVPGGSVLSSAELYDPSFNTWSLATSMAMPRIYHAAVLLNNGKVLVIGGGFSEATQQSAELYDPTHDTWAPAKSMSTARGSGHSATVLASGKVLVAGGVNNYGIVATTEVYDPSLDTWTPAAPMLGGPRAGQTATLLPDGTVLITGGINIGGSSDVPALASAEIYDPLANTWSSAGTMSVSRVGHTAARLQNNKVLIAAGFQFNSEAGALSSSELFTITNQPPAQPVNLSPSNGATNVSLTLTLFSSSFADPNSGDSHLASQWQITTTSGNYASPVFDSGVDTSHLTIITVPSGALTYSTTYYWRARHQDNHGDWSGYSSEASFTTVTQTVSPPPPTTTGRRSLPDPSTFIMVGSGLAVFLLYIGFTGLRRRLNRSQ